MAHTYITVVPAYGRDYRSKKEVLRDWDETKDFVINTFNHPDDGRYINKIQQPPGSIINIRYAKMTKVCVVK